MTNNKEQTTNDSEIKPITPGRCLVGASISGGLGVALYLLTAAIAQTYIQKPVTFTSPMAVNIAVTVRTLVIGIMAMGTGVFILVAIGLTLLAIQLIIKKLREPSNSTESPE